MTFYLKEQEEPLLIPIVKDKKSYLKRKSPECIREQYLNKLGYTPLRFLQNKEENYLINIERMKCSNRSSFFNIRSPSLHSIIPPAGSIRGSVFNLAGATLGAGALSLPYAVAVSGIGFALFQLILASSLTVYTIHLLIRAGDVTGLKSYEDLAVFCFGKKVALFVELNILIFCFGISIAYLVTFGDIFHPLGIVWFGVESFFAQRSVLMIISCITIMLPLSMLRDISSLQFSSILGVFSIIFLVFAVSLRSIEKISTEGFHDKIHWVINKEHWPSFMLSVPIMMFAFTCQVNVFSIYTELQRPCIRRMAKVVDRATMISLLIYTTIGIFAYMAYGNSLVDPERKGNILLSFCLNDPLIAFARAAITFTVCVAFPLNIFPCRFTLEMMFFANAKPSMIRHVLITFLLVMFALFLAIFCPNINVVFGIIGGTCSCIVCFCLPAAYILKITKRSLLSKENLGPLLLFFGAIIIGILGTAITIWSNFTK